MNFVITLFPFYPTVKQKGIIVDIINKRQGKTESEIKNGRQHWAQDKG
jgi:hypothetical protein